MSNNSLGFEQQQVITISLRGPLLQVSEKILKNRILQNPGVRDASLTNGTIGVGLNNKSSFNFFTKTSDVPVSGEHFVDDKDFLDVLKIPVREGGYFSSAPDGDSSQVVLINEAMLKRIGWKAEMMD